MVLEATQLRIVGPVGPSISQIVSKIAPIFTGVSIGGRAIGGQISKTGLAAARARTNLGPSAVPVASNAIRTTSVLGKTRAGLNLKGRDIAIIGGSTAALGITSLVTQPGPGGSSAVETITEGLSDIAPSVENVTNFLRENGLLVALIGLGLVTIVLIK